MSDTVSATPEHIDATMGDLFALLKPRVMSLVVFTAIVGMIAAPASVHPVIAFASVLFIAIGAGASGALNMWWDADIDWKMKRTRSRPIPSGKVAGNEALQIGVWLSGLSVLMLGLAANLLAAALLAFTIFFYVAVYTMFLKRLTPQNIVIGGAAGALPPIIGWVVATGTVAVEPILMFLVIFLWTPPHFWALALFSGDDYERAGVPMLTVVKGSKHTRGQILWYSLALLPVCFLLSFSSIGGPATAAMALLLNVVFVIGAIRLYRRTVEDAAQDRFRIERKFFLLSLIYLFALFAGLAIDATARDWFAVVSFWPQVI